MREYPQDFDTDVFPQSRSLAIARTFAVWSGIVFFVIIFIVGIFMWSGNSMRMRPFLIAIDSETGRWNVISETRGIALEYTSIHAIQESVAGNFARRWFTISDKDSENEARWCRCDTNSCVRSDLESGQLPCLVCCASSSELYSTFSMNVLTDYRARVLNGETWVLAEDSIHLHPESSITENGGLWHIEAMLISNKSEPIKIEAYIRVGHADNQYPMTMGFYVVDFNAYPAYEQTMGGI